MKNKDADNDSPDSSDASPDGIGNADGDSLCGFCQKHCTQHIKHGKARNPEPILRTNCEFGLAEAKSEACFTEARYDKDDPIHGCKSTKKSATKPSPELRIIFFTTITIKQTFL